MQIHEEQILGINQEWEDIIRENNKAFNDYDNGIEADQEHSHGHDDPGDFDPGDDD